MSENISLPAARVPMVNGDGMITSEWLTLLSGMFRRVGGPVGFSNSELYGDAVALQSYDELLERISSLEAQNRSLGQVVQMLAQSQFDPPAPQSRGSQDTFDRITVRGQTDLATQSGTVKVGAGVDDSLEKVQIEGGLDVSEVVKVRGKLTADVGGSLAAQSGRVIVGAETAIGSAIFFVNGDANASAFKVGDQYVLRGRQTGFPVFGPYAGQTMDATYSQAKAQATDNAIKNASTKLAQVVTALRTHGLIGD